MNPRRFLEIVQHVMVREWERLGRSKHMLFLIGVLPLLVLPFLVYIYSSGVLRDLPVGICDDDHSELTRLIIRSLEATSAFRIVEYDQSVEEIRAGFREGRLQAAFYFPPSFERDVKRGSPATVVVYNNASNLVVSNTVLKEGTTLIKTMSGAVLLKKVRSRGLQETEAMDVVNPLRIQVHPLYNPNYNYMNFLVIGLVPIILQMIVMVSSVTALNGEIADGSFADLVQTGGRSAFAILLGKFLSYFLIHSCTGVAIVAILFPAFGVASPVAAVPSMVLLVSLVAASVAAGLFLSALVRGTLVGTEVVLFLNIPAFLFSGFIFPFWAMPAVHQAFAQILPSTHFIYGFLKVFQMGEALSAAYPDSLRLLAFTVVLLLGAGFLLRYCISTQQREDASLQAGEAVS